MKKLSHEEMLSLPEAEGFQKKDDEKALADYLVRRLYGKKLSDFVFTEAFMIEAQIATLKVSEEASELSSDIFPVAKIVEMVRQANSVQEQIKNVRASMAHFKSPGMMEMTKNVLGAAKRFVDGGFSMVSDDEYKRRMELCAPCEFWNPSARMGMGKCLKCGCTSAKLRFATEKCPLNKWLQFDTTTIV